MAGVILSWGTRVVKFWPGCWRWMFFLGWGDGLFFDGWLALECEVIVGGR